jgi:hypothetical protein
VLVLSPRQQQWPLYNCRIACFAVVHCELEHTFSPSSGLGYFAALAIGWAHSEAPCSSVRHCGLSWCMATDSGWLISASAVTNGNVLRVVQRDA